MKLLALLMYCGAGKGTGSVASIGQPYRDGLWRWCLSPFPRVPPPPEKGGQAPWQRRFSYRRANGCHGASPLFPFGDFNKNRPLALRQFREKVTKKCITHTACNRSQGGEEGDRSMFSDYVLPVNRPE